MTTTSAPQWPLLESLSAADRAHVLTAARRRSFDRGERVFREGDPGDSLHLVEAGLFAVEVAVATGEEVIVNVLAAGSFFGEMALLRDSARTRTASVRALVPSQALVIAGSAFNALRATHPSVDQLVVVALAQRVEELGARLLEALYVGVDRRVYRRLVELAEICNRASAEVIIPVSQADLATMAGASRPTVNQVLQKLVSRGIISLQRRQITIENLGALRAGVPGLQG